MSRFNAKTSGIYAADHVLPCESEQEYAELRVEVFADRAPVGPIESEFCEQIFGCLWRFRSLAQAEQGAVARSMLVIQNKDIKYQADSFGALEEDQSDDSLNQYYSDIAHRPRDRRSETISPEASAAATEEIESETPDTSAPSPQVTFLKSYGSAETNKACLEIGRVRGAIGKELQGLLKELDTMQTRRERRAQTDTEVG